LIEDEKPSLVVFGQSFFLFPHRVRELADACSSAGSRIAFDGSHVLGLIAGGKFQKPLEEGAELPLGSTHKSLFGPQGRINRVKCSEYGFTESHQTILDVKDQKEIEAFTQRLEDANIIVDHGIRIGTCEATRRGMKARDMERVAELLVRVYKGEEPSKVRTKAT